MIVIGLTLFVWQMLCSQPGALAAGALQGDR